MLRLAWLVLLMSLSACGKDSKPTFSTDQMAQAERVAWVGRFFQAQGKSLPSAIEDAHFSELALGSGDAFFSLGPTDFVSYLHVKVPVEAVDSWTRALHARSARPPYVAPQAAYPPWIGEAEFSTLDFFEPAPLSHRVRGWIGVSRAKGELFIYGATD